MTASPDAPSLDDVLREAEESLAGSVRDEARDLLLLLEFAKAVNAIGELAPLLDLALHLLLEVSGAERGALLLLEGAALGVAASRGSGADGAVSRGIAAEVLRTGKPFHSDDLGSDPRAELMQSVHDQALAWAVAVPLRRRDEVVGVFYADSRRAAPRLPPGALSFVEALAEHAAIAIERARLLALDRERERAVLEVEELRRMDREKSLFIHKLVHELGNPLTAIAGYGKRLAAAVEEPKLAKAARIVVEESERLTTLVGELLDLARAKEAVATRRGAPTDLSLVQTVSQVAERFEGGSLVPPERDAILEGTDDDLLRVLSNLVSNALKHGARTAWITVDAGGTGRVSVEVHDDGPGVPDGLAPRIFDEFARGDGAGPGHGLGLSIVRDLVRARGGEIAVGRGPRGGASFRWDWPGRLLTSGGGPLEGGACPVCRS